jgi:hypothetical protein
LINGDNQTATTEKFSNEPHNNITKKPSDSIADHVDAIKTSIETKGTGMTTSNLYRHKIATVQRIFCWRRGDERNVDRNEPREDIKMSQKIKWYTPHPR